MMHSKKFEQIKEWYANGHWSRAMVLKAVEKGLITVEEYKEIVGGE